jgi:hypothetical protein
MVLENHKEKASIEKLILEIVEDIKSLNTDEIYQEMFEVAQSANDQVYDGDISDEDVLSKREEIENEIISSFIVNLQFGLTDDERDEITQKIIDLI